LILLAIKFSGENLGGIFLRWNELQKVPVPEWERSSEGQEITHPIAYFAQQKPVVKAKLRFVDSGDRRMFRIRAVYPNARQKIALAEFNPSAPPYGTAHQDEWQAYQWQQLPNDLNSVDVHEISLLWQYAEDHFDSQETLEWNDLTITNHRIFVLLDRPSTGPWSLLEGATNNPWVGALELACLWARGATTEEEGASKITRQIYSMGREKNSFRPGQKIFKYKGGESFSNNLNLKLGHAPYFNLTRFLAHLKKKNAGIMGGSCEEFASIVVTFSNLLGCHLTLKRFEPIEADGFTLNSVLLIGSDNDDWRSRSTSGNKLSEFAYHVVACPTTSPSEYLVYDSCLAVEETANPSLAHSPLVPTGMKFGPLTDPQSYLYRLIDSQDRRLVHIFVHPPDTYPSYYPIIKSPLTVPCET
jgi:hypothetical protein